MGILALEIRLVPHTIDHFCCINCHDWMHCQFQRDHKHYFALQNLSMPNVFVTGSISCIFPGMLPFVFSVLTYSTHDNVCLYRGTCLVNCKSTEYGHYIMTIIWQFEMPMAIMQCNNDHRLFIVCTVSAVCDKKENSINYCFLSNPVHSTWLQ